MTKEHLSPKIPRRKYRIKCVLLESSDPSNDIIVSYYVGMTLGYGTKRNKIDFSADPEEAFLMIRRDAVILIKFIRRYVNSDAYIYTLDKIDL